MKLTKTLLALALSSSAFPLFGATCESVLKQSVPHVTILLAQSIPAGAYQPPGSKIAYPDLPAFCRVVATVTPAPDSSIGIELWLPTAAWNGRYQQVGNHGWAGVIHYDEMAPQLRRGFAAGATDDGHTSNSPNPFNVDWAFGHPAKIQDIAWRAVHELALAGKTIVTKFYDKAPAASYFNGCSDGGREGMREAHDFPEDFDGILVGGAATYWTHAATEQLVVTSNLQKSGLEGTAGAALLKIVERAASVACTKNNATTAGIVDNADACHWDPHELVCRSGADPSTCLTLAQADALSANFDEVRDPVTHEWVFSGMSRGSEFDQLRFKYNEGLSPFALSNYQLALNNSQWDGVKFDLHADLPVLDRTLGIMNMTDPDLRKFAARGGKLIQYHGWQDAAFTPGWTIRYYNQVVATSGRGSLQSTQSFYRLFMVPGLGHCSGGPGPINFGEERYTAVSNDDEHDAVTALMDWFEHGKAPKELLGTPSTDGISGGASQPQQVLLPYPAR